MHITSHKLVADQGEQTVTQLTTPNVSPGIITPSYLIIHYTAGNSAGSSINWLMNPQAQASAHLVIARDGTVTQLGAFNKRMWHAGPSRWANLEGMNSHSIGIELDNSGRLRPSGNDYVNASGRIIPPNEIVFATHKHETTQAAWHNYPQAQLDALNTVALVIVRQYGLLDILGHEDIAPFRKSDPGPAFPMNSFNAHILGRADDTGDIFKTNTAGVNFRSAPAMGDNIIAPLPVGTKVEYISANAGWFNVYIVSKVANLQLRTGWIHSSVLTKV